MTPQETAEFFWKEMKMKVEWFLVCSCGHRVADEKRSSVIGHAILNGWRVDHEKKVMCPKYMEKDKTRTPVPAATACPVPWVKGSPGDIESVECGDRFLVLFCIKPPYWDAQVIVFREDGWDDVDGESWVYCDIGDVGYYLPLNKTTLPR